MRHKRFSLLLAALFLTAAPPLAGQMIRGRVLAAGDTVGIEGVTVTLMNQGENPLFLTQTDAAGQFQISVAEPGRYGLELKRIGYRTFLAEVVVGEREMVEVELRMAEEAILLEPLIVTARREIQLGTLDEFYDRMERNRQRGVGQFLTREDFENSPAASTTLQLAMVPGLFLEVVPSQLSGYGIMMRSRGDYCAPDYYLDGLLTSSDRLPPMEDIEGVEVYRTRFEHVENYWASECGIIFMWRKPDYGNPFSRNRFFLAVGLVSVGWLLTLLF
jgi:hypothetical protein